MASLGNLLNRAGLVAMTPRIVKLTLAIPDPKGGAPLVPALPLPAQVEVALLPVSEARKAKAVRAGYAYVESRLPFGDAPALGDELVFQFLVAAMRDAADLRQPFADATNIDSLRDIIVGEQQTYLVAEYRALILSEYSEITDADIEKMKQEATTVFPKGQGSP